MNKFFKFLLFFITFFILNFTFYIPTAKAVSDPLSVPNNKFGIHIISATTDEASAAAELVNSGGDWGYITVLIESKDRDTSKWQKFFDYLREHHLIPLVRLATQPEGNFWKKPYDGEETAWADFLDNLNWPTKNRYVIIYNEPNHAQEWGNLVDAKDYANTLNKTIDALKKKSDDFFVLNAGFDASAPQKLPAYQDQSDFMQQMEEAVPGIFNKLDGWVSHSYPNPGFVGSPDATGRGTVRTWAWELDRLKELNLTKTLPIFITETGWKHSDGKYFDSSLPSPELVGKYFKNSFNSAWSSRQIVAVTPFLLNYQEPPFDHFSFQKMGQKNDFQPPFFILKDMPKTSGRPTQDFKFKIDSGTIYNTLVAQETYNIPLTIRNTGQSIWNDSDQIKLVPQEGKELISNENLVIPFDKKIEPNNLYTFTLQLNPKKIGVYNVKLILYHGTTQFNSLPIEFTTEVTSPVSIQVKASLKWKNNFAGEYLVDFVGVVSDTIKNVILSPAGLSNEVVARSLLPDNSYDFTLHKPFYQPKTIHQKINRGLNTLDFGQLQPDITSAVLHPTQLWKLLPFSN